MTDRSFLLQNRLKAKRYTNFFIWSLNKVAKKHTIFSAI